MAAPSLSLKTETRSAEFHVVLMQPPAEDFYDTDIRLEPLGLFYLKAAIEDKAKTDPNLKKIKITVRDYRYGYGRRTVSLPQYLRSCRDLYSTPDRSFFSSFFNYYRFGASDEEIINDLKQLNPDIVGISFLFTAYHRETLILAEKIRSALPDVLIAAGGSHASAAPESLLKKEGIIDYIFTGEAEVSFAEFVSEYAARKTYSGLADPVPAGIRDRSLRTRPFRGQIVKSRPVHPDNLPLPSRSDSSCYTYKGRRLAFIMTSRGCPWKCSFCSVHTVFGHGYRRRSNESVMQEIRELYRSGYEAFDFEDDNLTFRKKESSELFIKIAEEFPERKLFLYAMNGISHKDLDTDLIEILYNAGFRQLNLSLVSLSDISRSGKRNDSNISSAILTDIKNHYQSLTEYASSLGLPVVSYQILGLPRESSADIMNTLIFQSGLPVSIGASPYYTVPGLQLPEKAFRDPDHMACAGRITSMTQCSFYGDGMTLTDDNITFENQPRLVTAQQIHSFFILIRIINFIKQYPQPFRISQLPDVLNFLEKSNESGNDSAGRKKNTARFQRSIYILRNLLNTGILLADTGKTFTERKGTDPAVFSQFIEADPLIRPIPETRE